ncbi:hypothetical protein MML48_5g00021712 [Holotrichia oblita]|uniref:Uncharacterized protein n=1 Tax=Holotrichia oblita TaxID=644536 RepID=A0ACB9T2C5_HOLOL|nr:hypothetical protein MML48_5g00021712 [Holotrichia oblita]
MMENRERDDLNALTSQVLEYYKTYSQNRNFSSYLRGTIPNVESGDSINTIEVREVANDEEETTPFLSVQSDNDENNINLGNVSEEQGRIPSPTSSVTSNRKLEWDNLADIGYGNCRKQKNLHKSLSLPLLTTLEKIQLGQRKLRASPESNVIDHGTQTQGIIKNSPLESISSESYKKSSLLSTNTTTSFTENVPTIDTSSTVSSLSKLVSLRTESDLTDVEYTVVDNKVVNRLEKYIGLPMAESTPNNVKDGGNSSKTGKIKEDKDVLNPDEKLPNNKENLINTKNEESPVETGNVTELKCVAKCFRNNIKHLSLTKPLTVECYAHKEISDKDMQTSTVNDIKTTSIAIQTDDCPENDDTVIEHKICPVYEDRRIIEYVKHSDFPDEPSSRSVGTNTNSDVRISQCNSFEYLYGAQISDRSKSQSNTPSHSDESKNERKRTATETDRTSDLSSKANPLAELISTKLSQHVVNDVDKSIIILQKLLKSKKYDKVTKQYYIKKIAQKIINCNYSSQSSTNSVTSSETTDDNQNQSDTANLPNTDKPLKISKTQQHQEAMPQVPVISNSNENLKTAKRRQLDIKTFSTEILPEKPMIESSIKPQKSSKLKDARFTIASKYNQYATSDELSQIGDVIPDLPSLPSSPQQTTVETSGSSRKSSFKNWKEHATKSEKLLEDKLNRIHSTDTTSDDSELLNFAKKERENQISWINNEINHLNKLKDMLQKKKKRQIPNVEALIQPQVEDMTEKNKTTSVYVITTERSSATSSGTYKTVERSNESRDASKKCECLYAKCGSLPCDSSDCPLLNYNSDKSSKKE